VESYGSIRILLVESCIRTAEAYELITTLSVSLTVFLGYLPAAARATASPFLPRQFERLFEDLDFHGFAAEEAFTHYLMTQATMAIRPLVSVVTPFL
jgi:hypothetical protein